MVLYCTCICLTCLCVLYANALVAIIVISTLLSSSYDAAAAAAADDDDDDDDAACDVSCGSEVDINGTHGVCKWDYNGQGLQYEILAGPAFIVVYTLAGIPLSVVADFSNRRNLLVVSLAVWSLMTLLTGFVNTYWQLVVTRFLLGIG